MKTFVLGDIHGAYQALIQCFERSGFDYRQDRLIVLGDVCDGYPQVRESIDELLKVKQCDYLIGNHDLWALNWATSGVKENIWTSQGGQSTIASYGQQRMPQSHIDFLKGARSWLEFEKRLFVHGGFDPRKTLAGQSLQTLVWDRTLLEQAWKKHLSGEDYLFGGFEEIYVGHTTTETFHSLKPLQLCNIWMLDTGAGWSGKLSLMDIHTKQFWQSDLTPELYKGIQPR